MELALTASGADANILPMRTIHRIEVPTPFAVGPVNAYLIEGLEPALVDTGPLTEKAFLALERGLRDLGYGFSDLRRIVITHPHSDHSGLVGLVAAASGGAVLTHRLNRPSMEDYEGEWKRRRAFFRSFFQSHGVPDEWLDVMDRGSAFFRKYGGPASVHGVLEDGESVRLGDHEWEVLLTPGHTAGHICLYQPKFGALLSGDHLLPEISSNPTLEPPEPGSQERSPSLVGYLNSLRRIEALEVDNVFPGHGEPFSDFDEVIRSRLDHHEQRKEKIAGLLTAGGATLYEVCRELFPRLSQGEYFLGLSETLGHLELLEAEGRVKTATREGVIVYSPITRTPPDLPPWSS